MPDHLSTPAVVPDASAGRAGLVHREILQLVVLIVAAVGAFFLTRAVAANNRATTLHDAEEWYRRGQAALARSAVDDAVDAFRRAAARDRQQRAYVLALARALAMRHDVAGAQAALLSLRETAPEDPAINLALARLAAGQHDTTTALRFYRAALYAPWDADPAERRRVRLELVRFLLDHGDTSRASAEALAVSGDVPADAAAHVEVATLLARAGDQQHALAEFEQALETAPEDPHALRGAGRAAYALGDYGRARRYLRQAPNAGDDDSHLLSTVEFVLGNDPLAGHLRPSERRRRLQVVLAYVRQRVAACPAFEDAAAQTHFAELQVHILAPARLDPDVVEAGVELLEQVASRVAATCGPATPIDRALEAIARRHRSES
jgi:tetratricopeptide (TPR) repeat protein